MTKTIDKPPQFTDAQGRAWTIRLSVQALDDVQDITGLAILPEGKDAQTLTGLLFNVRKLSSVLWVLCRRQAEAVGVDERAFREGLEAESLTKGWEAIYDAVIFFIRQQSPGLAAAMAEVVQAEMRVVEAGAVEMVEVLKNSEVGASLSQATKDIAAELKRDLLQQLGNSVSKLRE